MLHKEFLLQRDRFLDELVSIEVASAKSMPEPEKPRMQRQRITGKVIRDRCSGELLYAKQVSFQMSPAELSHAFVIFDIGAETVGAEDAQELRPQKLMQHFGTAALGDGEKCEAMRYKNPKPEFHTIVAPSCFISIEDRFV
jgi:hypothetical protein